MITRSLRLRHGRVAIARSATPFLRQRQRQFSISNRRTVEAGAQSQEDYDSITADYEFTQHQRRHTGKVGASVEPHYKPQSLAFNPPRPEDITLELLLASQTHLGHRTSLWNPANSRYIHGVWGQQHDAIHIISLDVTAAHLRRACKIVEGVAAKGGLILFVGTRDGQALPVVRAATLAKGYHLFDKWRPGTITNAQQILGKCKQKVVNEMDREVLGFQNQMETRAAIKPDLVVCLNPLENYILLHECGLHNIPTIGIIDTDANPTWVTYPIPANDDSIRSISVIAGALGKAGEAGQARRLQRASEGYVDFNPAYDLDIPTEQDVRAARRLMENPDEEDREDEDETLLLNTSQEEIFNVEMPTTPAPAPAATVSQAPIEAPTTADINEEVTEAYEEQDELLTSLTGFSSEDDAPPLSKEEISELAETIEGDAENVDAETAAASAVEQQIREDAPDSFEGIANNSTVTQLAEEVESATLEAEASAAQSPETQRSSEESNETLPEFVTPSEDFEAHIQSGRAQGEPQAQKKTGDEKP